jgi:alkylation response protein AidB-like acyl-CoA dehydrogenase
VGGTVAAGLAVGLGLSMSLSTPGGGAAAVSQWNRFVQSVDRQAAAAQRAVGRCGATAGCTQTALEQETAALRSDVPLLDAVRFPSAQEQAQAAQIASLLREMGELAGGPIDRQAEYTDRLARPVLETYDRQGEVVNEVRYNPLYEESVRQVYGLGVVGCNYGPRPLPYTVHFALLYLLSQSDPGLACPVTLTASTAYVLSRYGSDGQRERYLPQLAVRSPGPFRDGATFVTEKQGGSDAGAAQTLAAPLAPGEEALVRERYGPGAEEIVRLTGEKWFASNADADLCLVTARPPGAPEGTKGLGLYLMPRRLADGGPNAYRLRRLKDKLGTPGLATGELELEGAFAELVTPPPEGFKHMLEALEFSRIANAAASAGIHRRVYLEAKLYADQREAFGGPLRRYPMVQQTIVTMLAELEAAEALAFCAARAFDAAVREASPEAIAFHRLTTALAKYRTGEVAVRNASRAIEVLGGNGYVEEYVTARMYREAQVLPVWEGPANIQALELLRTLAPRWRADLVLGRKVGEAAALAGQDARTQGLGALLERRWREAEEVLARLLREPGEAPRYARRLAEFLSEILEFSLLLREAAQGVRRGDERKLVLAWWLARLHLQPARAQGALEDLGWLDGVYGALTEERPVDGVRLPALEEEVSLR